MAKTRSGFLGVAVALLCVMASGPLSADDAAPVQADTPAGSQTVAAYGACCGCGYYGGYGYGYPALSYSAWHHSSWYSPSYYSPSCGTYAYPSYATYSYPSYATYAYPSYGMYAPYYYPSYYNSYSWGGCHGCGYGYSTWGYAPTYTSAYYAGPGYVSSPYFWPAYVW